MVKVCIFNIPPFEVEFQHLDDPPFNACVKLEGFSSEGCFTLIFLGFKILEYYLFSSSHQKTRRIWISYRLSILKLRHLLYQRLGRCHDTTHTTELVPCIPSKHFSICYAHYFKLLKKSPSSALT